MTSRRIVACAVVVVAASLAATVIAEPATTTSAPTTAPAATAPAATQSAGKIILEWTVKSESQGGASLTVSPDGKFALIEQYESVSDGPPKRKLQVVDTATGKAADLKELLGGDSAKLMLRTKEMSFSPDGKMLAMSVVRDKKCTVQLLDLAAMKLTQILDFPDETRAMALWCGKGLVISSASKADGFNFIRMVSADGKTASDMDIRGLVAAASDDGKTLVAIFNPDDPKATLNPENLDRGIEDKVRLGVIDDKGKILKTLLPIKETEKHVLLSPGGKHVMYMRHEKTADPSSGRIAHIMCQEVKTGKEWDYKCENDGKRSYLVPIFCDADGCVLAIKPQIGASSLIKLHDGKMTSETNMPNVKAAGVGGGKLFYVKADADKWSLRCEDLPKAQK